MVSIIMPAFNAERFIEETILSVQNQTYTDWELIIVDDGSTDQTAAIVKSMQADKRIKYVYQQNKKQAAARNNALSNATGNWIAFLDADDVWPALKLEKQLKYAEEINADVFYTGGEIVDEQGRFISGYNTVYGRCPAIEMYKLLFEGNPIPILSVMFKREWFEKVGLQDEDTRMTGCEDWDYWVRLAKAGADFYGIDENLFSYRRYENNTSSNYVKMTMAQACVYIKNFDQAIFNADDKKRIFNYRLPSLIVTLIKANRLQDAKYILDKTKLILPSVINYVDELLINLLGTRSARIVNKLNSYRL
ncbi:glycosyltransferase family 2 protein [Mucilaginibacter sp. AW1-3]